MTDLLDGLRAYGADVTGALERFVGDEKLYTDCFHLFLDDPAFGDLGRALTEQNATAAFEAAHSLKGLTGNLGLTPLFQTVCAMVETLRRGSLAGLDAPYARLMADRTLLEQYR
ncbi:MAG: Hpt domain-containing protein [Oscillibacter sp.]